VRSGGHALLLAVALAACSTDGMAFRVDESIDVISPDARATIDLPVTVAWSDEKAPTAPRISLRDETAEYYAVFVDRSPIRPGASIVDVVDDIDRDTCIVTPRCPDPVALRDRGVVLTDEPAITLEFLKDLRPTSRGTSKDPHEVTIVRMRGDRRLGEVAHRVTFFVRR
jgi:hypothetical protein